MEGNLNITNLNLNFEKKELEEEFTDTKKIKNTRKSKKNQNQNSGWNFNCGCGKTYFSYAALYTHAKLKHDGIFPEGTINLKRMKQGRPKKNNWSCTKLNENIEKAKEFNTNFVSFLDLNKDLIKNNTENLFDVISEFPINYFKNKDFYEPILLKLDELIKNFKENNSEDIFIEIEKNIFENLINSYNCIEVFSLFIIYISRFIEKKIFKEIVVIICSLMNFANIKGEEKCNEINIHVFTNINKKFCEINDPEVIPDLLNNFISIYFHDIINNNINENVNLEYFGKEKIDVIKLILFLQNFSNWLYLFKFTKAKLEINEDLS